MLPIFSDFLSEVVIKTKQYNNWLVIYTIDDTGHISSNWNMECFIKELDETNITKVSLYHPICNQITYLLLNPSVDKEIINTAEKLIKSLNDYYIIGDECKYSEWFDNQVDNYLSTNVITSIEQEDIDLNYNSDEHEYVSEVIFRGR